MFQLAPELAHSTIELAEWPLCKVLFKNEKNFVWFLLVPCRENSVELTDLSNADQQQLLTEINRLSHIIQTEFKPDKMNVATIGNQVPQLHVHVVGRYKTDPLWPESIWQSKYQASPYDTQSLEDIITNLKEMVQSN